MWFANAEAKIIELLYCNFLSDSIDYITLKTMTNLEKQAKSYSRFSPISRIDQMPYLLKKFKPDFSPKEYMYELNKTLEEMKDWYTNLKGKHSNVLYRYFYY